MEDKVPEYKIILLGDPGVGKTTFFLRLREQEFVDTEQRPSASIGVDDLLYEHAVDGTKVKVGVRGFYESILSMYSMYLVFI